MSLSTRQVWEEFNSRLYQYINTRVQSPEDAKDILQDVFIKVHSNLEHLRDESRLAAWLYRITRNEITEYYRSARPSIALEEQIPVQIEFYENNPEAEIAASLKDMIERLPDKYRQALTLVEYGELNQREVADRLGISLSGAKSRIQRGRAMLKEMLLDCCHFEFDRTGKVINYMPKPRCCPACRNSTR